MERCAAVCPAALRARRPFLSASFILICLVMATAVDWQVASALVNIGESQAMRTTLVSWLFLQASAAYRLIGLTLWPVGLTVDADIDLIPLVFQWFAGAALCGMVALTGVLHRRQPLVAYGLAWYLVSLVPRLIIQTPRSYLNEHQFYVPLMGLDLAGVAWWDTPRQTSYG